MSGGVEVAAFDLSLNSIGVARVQRDGTIVLHRIRARTTGYERLREIERECRRLAAGADVAIVEEPAWGAKGKTYHQLAGGWWMCTAAIWDAVGDRMTTVNQAAIKAYATGSGGSDKDKVLAAAVRRFPHVDVNGNDEADALWAAAMARRNYGCPIDNVPQVNHRALEKVEWPAIEREDTPVR